VAADFVQELHSHLPVADNLVADRILAVVVVAHIRQVDHTDLAAAGHKHQAAYCIHTKQNMHTAYTNKHATNKRNCLVTIFLQV